MRRAAFVFALIAALGACARCPEPRSLRTLPAPVRDRVVIDHGAIRGRVSDPSPPGGPVTVTLPAFVRVDSRVTWALGAGGGAAVPMGRAGRLWSIDATAIAVEGERTALRGLRLDTGLGGVLSVSTRDAAPAGLALIDEVPAGESYTAFGPKPARFGVFAALDLGPAEIAPVGAQVECGGPGFGPLLGLDALAAFGGVVFDWPAGRLVLLPRGAGVDGVRALAGWRSAEWTEAPIESRRDSLDERGSGARVYTIAGGGRWARVRIGQTEHAAVLDTGFSADVFGFEPTGLGRDGRAWAGSGFGRSASFRIAELDAPVEIGPIAFDGATILEPERSPADIAQRGGADLVIGLGLLERYPVWFDFERDAVRFWVSGGPVPAFPGVQREDRVKAGTPRGEG